MNIQHQSRTGDPLLDRVDGLIAWAVALREDIVREREAQQADREGMLRAAGQIARSDYMSNKEVADYLGLSASTVQHAGNRPNDRLACIYRGRIGSGRGVRYARRRIEAHLQNMASRKYCGECDEIAFAGLKRGAHRA